VVGSPLFPVRVFLVVWVWFNFVSGRLHRVAFLLILRSPLSEPESGFVFLGNDVSDVGEIHRVVVVIVTLVLPSVFVLLDIEVGFIFFRCRGDYTG